MKVLVTGGTGAFGTAVCERLARAGADPVAMARNEPAGLPAGVRFVAGDIRDADAVQAAVSGCDAVVHLAWFMGVGAPEDQIRGINEGGTRILLDAMERAGCARLVFTSSTSAYGTSQHHPAPFREDEPLRPSPSFLYAAQKHSVEELIAERGFDAVIARVTVVLGRSVDNDASQAYAGPALLDIGGRSVVQAVHQDDVGRFIETGVLGTMRGTVNLAAPGSVPMARAGELLQRRVRRVPLAAAVRAADLAGRFGFTGMDAEVVKTLAFWPVADTTRLTEEWGFTPVWEQEDILRDQARSASRSTHLLPGTRKLHRPRRLPWAATTPPDPASLRPDAAWTDAAPPELRGQFDTRIDPAFPVYSATNLSEAFPGPMTPLSLQLALHGIGAATDALVQLFGLEGETADLMRLGVASFGHSVYVNVSAARLMAELVPGATVEDVDRMYLGIDAPPAPKQRMAPKEVLAAARLGGRIAPRLAGLRAEVDRICAEADELGAVDPAQLTDDQLLAHLSLVHDMVCQAWATSSTGNFLLSGLADALDDQHVGGSAGAETLRGVHQLAAEVRRTPGLPDLLAGEPDPAAALATVRREHPGIAASVDALVQRCGHRGPGETELEREVFADRPEWLLDVVRRAAVRTELPSRPGRTAARRPGPSTRLAHRVLEDKERARDAGVRLIHAFRVATRERARRLVRDGGLGAEGDVFYLTYDELFARTPPGPAVLDARKAERERLAAHRMPLSFEGSWAPAVVDDSTAGSGDVLRGVGAVGGSYEGRVRVMQAPTDDLEPGEVLVAVTTDIGWTPYFALAGAIVTDVGGVASHAAIVAREHGIPSVVGTRDATARLRTGMQVVVDGSAGTVTVRPGD